MQEKKDKEIIQAAGTVYITIVLISKFTNHLYYNYQGKGVNANIQLDFL